MPAHATDTIDQNSSYTALSRGRKQNHLYLVNQPTTDPETHQRPKPTIEVAEGAVVPKPKAAQQRPSGPRHPEPIEYDPTKEYTLKEEEKTYNLIEQTVSAQGQPVQKVTVFNKVQVPGKPQILAYLLQDGKTGAEICRATVLAVQAVPVGGDHKAVLPQTVELVWKPQQIKMTMQLYATEANSINVPQAAKLFSRGDLQYPAANLARNSDLPTGFTEQSGIQPARLNAPVK